MKKLIDRFFAKRYLDGDGQTYQQALALISILLGLVFITILLSTVLGSPRDKIFVLAMAVVNILLLLVVRAGKAKVAGVVTVIFLAVACALLVLTKGVATYIDVYQLAYLEIFVLFITLLITTDSMHAYIVMVLGVASIFVNYFFRALPAQLEGASPDLDDQIITIALIVFAGLIVVSSNRRGRHLLASARRESAANQDRAERLKGVVGRLHSDFDTGEDLLESSESMSNAVVDLEGVMRMIQDEVTKLAENSEDLERAGNEIADISTGVARNSESHSAVIEQTSAAITEMASSIESISRIAADRKRIVNVLADSAENAEHVLEQSTEAMSDLRELISSLEEVSEVISGIAAQTGLLAMNAAIEAAHAGEAGRGFAVVADEVRKLSENSAENVKSISDMLKEIGESVENAVGINSSVTDSFHSIREEITGVVAGMDEILSGVSELSAGTTEINSGTSQSVSSTSMVRSGIESVNSKIQKITAAMNEQKAASRTVLGAVEGARDKLNIVEAGSHRVHEVGKLNVDNLRELGKDLEHIE